MQGRYIWCSCNSLAFIPYSMYWENMKNIKKFFSRIREHNIFGMSAKTAYYLILSFFPLMLLMLSAVSSADTDMFAYIMPPFVIKILDDIMKITPDIKVAALSFAVALWSASTAIWALMDGIHLAYTGRVHDKLKNGRIRAIVFTLILMIMAFVFVSAAFLSGMNFNFFIFIPLDYNLYYALRIFLVLISIFTFIVLLYSMTPCVKIKLNKTFFGIIITSISWLLSTWGFDIYMNMFNNYSVIYGSIGAFLGLALWLYAVTLILFLGAELNAILLERAAIKK